MNLEQTRRSFLKWLAAAVGLLSFLPRALGRTPPKWTLTPLQRGVLAQASERILPSDDGPGAREAKVIEYIAKALESAYHAPLRPLFTEGVRRIEALARSDWEQPFLQLEAEDQDRVLDWVQRGGVSDATFDGKRFFHRLVELTLEGFLGDPVHGGNKGQVGWTAIGYTPGGPRPGACGEHH